MKSSSWAFVPAMGVWTAVTLAGGFVLLFEFLVDMFQQPSLADYFIPLLIISLFVVSFAAGGLWGYGIGRMMKMNARAIAPACALTWMVTVFCAAMILGLFQGPAFAITSATPFDLQTPFTLAFVPIVGLVTAINTWKLAGKLGLAEIKRNIARNAGVAAAAGCLIMDLILWFGFEWEVGRPLPGYSMLTFMVICNFAAALAGGLALGWTMVRQQESTQFLGAIE